MVSYCLSQSVVAHSYRRRVAEGHEERTPAEAVGETIWTGWVNMININQNRRNQINCEYIVSYQMGCICFQSPLCSFSPLFSLLWSFSWIIFPSTGKLSRPVPHLFDLLEKINSINGTLYPHHDPWTDSISICDLLSSCCAHHPPPPREVLFSVIHRTLDPMPELIIINYPRTIFTI